MRYKKKRPASNGAHLPMLLALIPVSIMAYVGAPYAYAQRCDTGTIGTWQYWQAPLRKEITGHFSSIYTIPQASCHPHCSQTYRGDPYTLEDRVESKTREEITNVKVSCAGNGCQFNKYSIQLPHDYGRGLSKAYGDFWYVFYWSRSEEVEVTISGDTFRWALVDGPPEAGSGGDLVVGKTFEVLMFDVGAELRFSGAVGQTKLNDYDKAENFGGSENAYATPAWLRFEGAKPKPIDYNHVELHRHYYKFKVEGSADCDMNFQ